MIRYIKSGIVYLYTFRGHALLIPHLGDLFRLALLDADICAGNGSHVNGRCRCTDIYRYTVLLCYRCYYAGADLVGRISVSRHSVTTHEHCLYPALGHYRSRHIVADQCDIHARGMQFKSSQSGSLQQGSGLIRKYMEVIALLLSQINRCCCSTIFYGCKLSCITVSQDAISRFHQFQAKFSDFSAYFHIFCSNLQCFVMQDFLHFCDSLVLFSASLYSHSIHALQRPGQIDCGGSGRIQIFLIFGKFLIKLFKIFGLDAVCQQINTQCRRYADGRSPSDFQQINGIPNFLCRM